MKKLLMDFCFNCGDKTDPDWVFCRACGSVLEDSELDNLAPIPSASALPKVELISRGWDVIDVDTIETPVDPLEGDDVSPGPLPPDTIEVSVDDVTVVEKVDEDEPPETAPAATSDSWDHLRPHGEQPPLRHRVGLVARTAQGSLMLVALASLVSAGLHFYHNTRLDAFSEGQTSAGTVAAAEDAARTSGYVVAGLIILALLALGLWFITARKEPEFRPGRAGNVALMSFVAAGGIVAGALTIDTATSTRAIGVNSLLVLGLGLLVASCLVTVRTVERIASKAPA